MAKRNLTNKRLSSSTRPQAARASGSGLANVTSICIGLFVIAVWVFWPSVSNDFVNLDDPLYVSENVHVLGGVTWPSIRWALTSLDGGFWHPLTWLSLMMDCQLFGLRAGGHHLISLLLHATNTLLLFLAFRRLTGACWRSAAVAALFALHPLHVESVAWVSDRKDILSAFFWMLALLAYAVYAERSKAQGKESESSTRPHLSPATLHTRSYYLLSLFFFVCGLMSKATVLTLPFILLLLDWWPLRRFHVSTLRHLLLEKLPFFVSGALAGLASVYGQKQLGALPNVVQFPFGDRVANAVLSFVRYVAQTFWPVNLAAYYPYPATFPFEPVIGAAVLSLAASALLLWAARQRPHLAVGWLWFIVTILPVIGLLQVGGHARADRYTYVPLTGLFLLGVWAVHDYTRRWRYQSVFLCAAAVLVISVCAVLTRRQIGYWKDSETLLAHAIAVTRDNFMAQNNLGVALTKQGQLDEAVTRLQEAVRLAPNYAEAYNNLGTALAKQGRLDEAIGRFQESLRLKPNYAQAHNDLGAALGRQGRLDEAIAHLEEATRLVPDSADARCNLGDALAGKGRFDEAITQYRQAIQLNPNYSDTPNHLGIALSSKGRLDEAIEQFHLALKLNPDYAEAHGNLGAALGRKGHFDEAIGHLQEAVRLKPAYAAAQKNLSAALAAKAAAQDRSGPTRAP
jgi:protein O-mannosyl-transferase